jgi:hypothetical protein
MKKERQDRFVSVTFGTIKEKECENGKFRFFQASDIDLVPFLSC